MSPRAAGRLESLGFDNICDYVAGKQDWLAYGLPIEGELSEAAMLGKLAHREVPVCRVDEKVADLGQRLQPSNWRECVVVNDSNVILGLIRKALWDGVNSDLLVEQAMELSPATFRPHVRADEMLTYMQKKKMKTVLVSTSDGKLVGLVRRKDLEELS